MSVVKPGTQTRRFTHIYDTVEVCYEAFKKASADIIVSVIKFIFNIRSSQVI